MTLTKNEIFSLHRVAEIHQSEGRAPVRVIFSGTEFRAQKQFYTLRAQIIVPVWTSGMGCVLTDFGHVLPCPKAMLCRPFGPQHELPCPRSKKDCIRLLSGTAIGNPYARPKTPVYHCSWVRQTVPEAQKACTTFNLETEIHARGPRKLYTIVAGHDNPCPSKFRGQEMRVWYLAFRLVDFCNSTQSHFLSEKFFSKTENLI